MTRRERVLASLRHEPPDKTPYHVGFTWRARQNMAEFLGDPDFESRIGNCFRGLSCYSHTRWSEVRPNVFRDPFGVEWDRSVDQDIGVVANRLITPESLESYEFPDPEDPAVWALHGEAVRTKIERDVFVIANLGFSLFERAWTLAGMEEVMMAMAADPPFAHRLLDRILEHNLAVIRKACSYDIDVMMFGDDWGMQTGVLMGIDLWRVYVLPRVREMYQTAKAAGKFVFIHSCGKVDSLFPDLIDAGVDVFNPFQPEVIDVYEAKRAFGDRLCFFGGISTQRTLPAATPNETRAEVRRLLDEVGRNGGYFAAPAHDIPADARPENIAAMLEVLENQ